MAISQNPMTGQMTGSVANFVTTSRDGQNQIRSKAFNPRNANTPAQQTQRECFKITVEEFQSYGGVIDEGFPEKPAGQSSYNQFVAVNLPNAIDKSGEHPVIDYSKLLVSNGSLPQVQVTSATITAEGISIVYPTNVKIPKVNATDVVMVVAKTLLGELLFEKQARGEEKIGTILLDYPGLLAANVKCCYLFVLSADGSKASKSTYITVV